MKKLFDWIRDTEHLPVEEKHNYSFTPELILIGIHIFLIMLFLMITDVSLFGNKQDSIFDFWIVTHVLWAAAFSTILFRLRSFGIQNPVILLLLLSMQWEVFEVYVESGFFGNAEVTNWFGGTEHFLNRVLGDQLAVLVGFVIIKMWPRLFWFSLVTTFLFVGLHVYLGDSTFLV